MIKITKDRKGDNYIITAKDKEGFHKTMALSHDECIELFSELWEAVILDDALEGYERRKRNGQ